MSADEPPSVPTRAARVSPRQSPPIELVQPTPIRGFLVAPADESMHTSGPGCVKTVSCPVHTLLLAVEVLSPWSTRADRAVKRRLYQRQGVETYWIVDPDAVLVEVWQPRDERPEIVTDVLRWRTESKS